MSQSSANKNHGDDKIMAKSRKSFLDTGCYSNLLKCICEKAKGRKSIIDIGCGECYYTVGLYEYLKDINSFVLGIDISKSIIEVGCSRIRNTSVLAVVAGCTKIPVSDKSIDCALSVFAPISDSELSRIITDDGIVIRVTPATEHLIELKRSVYDNAFLNTELDLKISGFEIVDSQRLTYDFTINNEQIKNLFTMTPYYYKTSKNDFEKLNAYSQMTITADFNITVYKKKANT